MNPYLTRQPGPPPLDWPHYAIGFGAAIKRGFRKYAVFSGRASLSEYWWWVLFTVTGVFAAALLAAILGFATSPDGGTTTGDGAVVGAILGNAVLLGTLLPSISVAVRRLHDAGVSGWYYLLILVPFGWIAVLVLLLRSTSPVRAAEYGPPAPPQPGPYYPGAPA